MATIKGTAVIDNRRETIHQLAADLVLGMAVELAEVEELVVDDPGLNFGKVVFPLLLVISPREAPEWADQDLGSDRDEATHAFVAVVATSWVFAHQFTLAVEVALNDIDQFFVWFDPRKIGEQIVLGVFG